jgi:4'-phosphopantetheinyl transferase
VRAASLAGHEDAACRLVTLSRRERVSRLRLLPDRLRSLAAGLLMRRCLGVRSDADLRLGPMGRPELALTGPSFSVSHAGDFAALALSVRGPVGLDLESLDRKVRRGLVADRTFSPEERGFLEGRPDDPLPFLSVWTRKESLVKAAGLGIFEGAGDFSVVPLDAPVFHALGSAWNLATATRDGHVFSVSVPYEEDAPLRLELLEVRAADLME